MISSDNFDQLRLELSIKSRNGIDFILAASLVWLGVTYIWTLDYPSYTRSVFTFMIGAVMMPLALLFSKLLKTVWTLKTNPLQSLGIWLNVAQLFYFPLLFFMLGKTPDYFVMGYAIITGAHFFPYSWFYKTPLFAIFGGLIAVGALLLGVKLPPEKMYLLPLATSGVLLVLAGFLHLDSQKKAVAERQKAPVTSL